ncbi:MAG: GPR1/FUN34/YaaH family transporter [Syntrophomonadaceae bacterium]|nr:GPR1/FUN34/YaaH family transporter [Syntrophomonadaceae bacterium]MDD4550244.1 GPR1/FUN34/YaaH family transporter [Syntrophomonadaceae bacterium]
MSEHEDWAPAGAAGLVALAMACFTFFALLTGRVDHSAAPLLGIWMLGGFVVQFVTAILELKEGNLLGGNVFTFFSAFFMLATGGVLLFQSIAAHHGMTFDARIIGWAWLPISIAVTLWTPAYLAGARSLSLVVVALVPALWIISFTDMGVLSKAWSPVAGYFLLAGGIFGIYTSAAIVLNDKFKRVVLPLGEPFIK